MNTLVRKIRHCFLNYFGFVIYSTNSDYLLREIIEPTDEIHVVELTIVKRCAGTGVTVGWGRFVVVRVVARIRIWQHVFKICIVNGLLTGSTKSTPSYIDESDDTLSSGGVTAFDTSQSKSKAPPSIIVDNVFSRVNKLLRHLYVSVAEA